MIIEINPDWAPLGAARFRELMDIKYFEGNVFFRVIDVSMIPFNLIFLKPI